MTGCTQDSVDGGMIPPAGFGAACTKAGESPLQGDCEGFDSLLLHESEGWVRIPDHLPFVLRRQMVAMRIVCGWCSGSTLMFCSHSLEVERLVLSQVAGVQFPVGVPMKEYD